MSSDVYVSFAYGLRISADFKIPDLTPADEVGESDVLIQRASVPGYPAELVERSTLIVGADEHGIRLELKDFGRFRIYDGSVIQYEPLSGQEPSSVIPTILGLGLGILLYQRGVFTLHASGIRHGDGCVAFVAHKGTGKSTTCANLHARGYPVVTDDVLAVTFDEQGTPRVHPAFPLVKLRPDAVRSLGGTADDLPRIDARYERRRLNVKDTFSLTPLPLKRIYLLEEAETMECVDLPAREGFLQLLTHSYVVRILGRAAATPKHFAECNSIMKQVPVRRLRRPRDLNRMPELIDLIEADLAQTETEVRVATA